MEVLGIDDSIESIIEKLKTSLHYNCGETCPKHCSLYHNFPITEKVKEV